MSRSSQVIIGAVFVLAFTGGPYFYFRADYAHHKRLREVVPGRFYRSGQLTAGGFADAVERLGIRTVVNVQDDVPDPDVWQNYLDRRTSKESEVCRRLGVRYVALAPDLQSKRLDRPRPKAIDDFLAVMDDEASYPVLLHCKAGLHRTGILTAIYRMQYQGWSVGAAHRELLANGFGEWVGTSANEYVRQYVLLYQPRPAQAQARAERAPGQQPR
jgi:protein tyrosine/serine phosphatase